ncbi:adenylyl-sulfate kinase [Streptomyces kanasensis]|uniref:adenylyl-sulfate kinase n=1 Tax=Streptomyces kanasensis TaxID=936756 RepID=UPI0037011D11
MNQHATVCTCLPGATLWLAPPTAGTAPAGATGPAPAVPAVAPDAAGAGHDAGAAALAERLRGEHRRVEVLEGTAGLGSPGDTAAAGVLRTGLVAEILARNGIAVLVTGVAPDERALASVRERHREGGVPFLTLPSDGSTDELYAALVANGLAIQAS